MFVTTTYTDTGVTNGTLYYYKYSVLDTDFNEVAWSNEVSVVPDDFSLPTTPAVTDDGATTHYFDHLHATWSSQDPETGIDEYQVCVGTTAGTCEIVSWTSKGTLTETQWSSLSLIDAQTYYVNVKARNGADQWSAVGSSDGITIDKLPPPVITAVDPITGVRNTSHVITYTGSGFQSSPAPEVKLGSTSLGSVNVVSGTQLTALVPAGIPANTYDASVTNYDTQVGTLSDAYTATNPAVGPRAFLLSPSSKRIGVDESNATVDVRVEDITDLGGFEFQLDYDPAIVYVDDVTLGSFLGSGGKNTAALGPTIDNGSGSVTFGGFSYGSGTGADGTGTLATITFSPQVTGTTALTLSNVQMRDSLNYEIPADPQDGEIEVVEYPFGDFDLDCDVDIADIMVVATRWDSHTGDPDYNPDYDFDDDGDIDVTDIMEVSAVWGHTCSGHGLLVATDIDVTGPSLSLVSQASPVKIGSTVEVAIMITNTDNLGGVQFDLLFDPDYLEYANITIGPALSSTGNSVQTVTPTVDSGNGVVRLGAYSFGDNSGPTNGQLIIITFTTLQTGATTVDLDNYQLVDLDRNILFPSEINSGVITIDDYKIYLPLVLR